MSSLNSPFGEISKRHILYDNEVKKVRTVSAPLPHNKLSLNKYLPQTTTTAEEHHGLTLNYGDRFIPRRHKINSRDNKNPNKISHNNTNNDWNSSAAYSDLLRNALGLHDDRQLSLQDLTIPRPFFSSSSSRDQANDDNFTYLPHRTVYSTPRRYKDLDWMCKPRKKPQIDADSSHEFEGFSGTAVGTRIEWTFTGHIVSYCDSALLLWNPSEEVITKYDFHEHIVTLAHHPFLRFLATSIQHRLRHSVKVWAMSGGAMLNRFCYTPKSGGVITTLCWNKFGLHLLSGNARGGICTLDFYGPKQLLHRTPSSCHSMIRDLKFSATGCYVASLDILGKLCVWSYNGGFLVLHHVWESASLSTPVSMDWHPWTNSDLALCVERGQIVIILNVQSRKTEAFATGGRALRFDRPVLSFNRVSAELVVGCSRKGAADLVSLSLHLHSNPLLVPFFQSATGCRGVSLCWAQSTESWTNSRTWAPSRRRSCGPRATNNWLSSPATTFRSTTSSDRTAAGPVRGSHGNSAGAAAVRCPLIPRISGRAGASSRSLSSSSRESQGRRRRLK